AASRRSRAETLQPVRTGRVRGAVVRRFLRNGNVMRVALLHTRRGHLNEPRLGSEFVEGPAAAVTHSGAQAADQLINEWGQLTLVGDAALDSFGHQFAFPVPAG